MNNNVKDLIKSGIGILAFAVGAVNMYLSANGYPCIAFDSAAVTNAVSLFVTLGGAVWSTWKNFNVTKAAKDGQEFINAVKSGDKEAINTVWDTVDTLKNNLKDAA